MQGVLVTGGYLDFVRLLSRMRFVVKSQKFSEYIEAFDSIKILKLKKNKKETCHTAVYVNPAEPRLEFKV